MRSELNAFGSAANDTVRIGACQNRTHFPPGTTARIFRPGRSVMSSGTADTKCWRLRFLGPGQRFIEPVMGWTGSTDPLAGLELKFPTLEAALRYARRQDLDFVVEAPLLAARTTHPPHENDASTVIRRHAA